MRFRWKLLILLALISIVPIVGLRTFGIHNVQQMADALMERLEASRKDELRSRLVVLVGEYEQSLTRTREQVEMALFMQAISARHLARPEKPLTGWPAKETAYRTFFPLASENEMDTGMCFTRSVGAAPGVQIQPDPADIRMLAETLHAVSERLGALATRQSVVLGNGLAAVYPCREGEAKATDPAGRFWLRVALRDRPTLWSEPLHNPATGRTEVVVSLLLEKDEIPVGVTSIVVPLSALTEPLPVFTETRSRFRPFIVSLAPKAGSDSIGARIEAGAALLRVGSAPEAGDWLTSRDADGLASLLRDLAQRRSGIREMPFDGRPSLWAYGPLPSFGSGFVFILPQEDVLQPGISQLRNMILQRTDRVRVLSAVFLAFLALLVLVLGVLFSRSVTRPLEILAKAARGLSSGNLDVKTGLKSRDEFGEIAAVFDGVGPKLQEHYRMRRAVEVAMEIQQQLLPSSPPSVPGLDMAAMTLYSDETGGDYFDYLCTGTEDRLCVAVGDISGHGLPSALLMANARGMLRLRSALPGSLEEIISDVNRRFAEDVEQDGRFMTLFLARINRERNRMEWVRAGHEPALLYDAADDTFFELKGSGLALGVSEEAVYQGNRRELRPGQVLCLYTDGIPETRNADGKPFGKTRLRHAIRENASASARTLLLSVLDAVGEFRGEPDQEDDLTLLMVKITPLE
ncbi:MAG: SpoIIE family protein phosphatase [Desulfobacteraceae bacterium]|nr:SpoIIE family protein phosphatase [Desulfobacteraceae bacterium]